MALPGTLDVQAALIYFHAYMYGPYRGRVRLFRARGLAPRMVMSEDWEVFSSILIRQEGTASASGPDLGEYEVKSAVDGGSFEYQYHRNSWQEKFAADRRAGHILIWHWDELSRVEVWYCTGADLEEHFAAWEAKNPYSTQNQQRFRQQVPAGWVRENATLLLLIEDGEATHQWMAPESDEAE